MTFAHRVNQSVGGGPLVLDKKTYDVGLGLNSFSHLEYKLDGQYKTFVATAGIDDAVRPAGNATLTILGDGKELCKPMDLTGKDEHPVELRLDLSGVKVLTIQVDYGPDKVAVGDHVDIVGARLVK